MLALKSFAPYLLRAKPENRVAPFKENCYFSPQFEHSHRYKLLESLPSLRLWKSYGKSTFSMNHYAILANPGHNRIYFEAALDIASSEIKAMTAAIDIDIQDIGNKEVGLPACICFTTTEPLTEKALKTLCTASIYYAIFEIHPEGLLKPLTPPAFNTFPESLNQILKYTGKTNEQFTRLMINLALSACKTSREQTTLIDPLCGKGTSLYEGMIRGFNVVGIEMNDKWVQEIQTYLLNYLKKGRYKHTKNKEKRTKDGKKLADGFTLETAATKEQFNKGNAQTIQLFAADTRLTNFLAKKSSCDILVSDLPYGVQHGSKNAKDSKFDRSPLELLKEATPAWFKVMKSKGALVISFNEFTLKWEDATEALSKAGFTVLNEEPYVNYLHRVDQSIHRNLMVAVKK